MPHIEPNPLFGPVGPGGSMSNPDRRTAIIVTLYSLLVDEYGGHLGQVDQDVSVCTVPVHALLVALQAEFAGYLSLVGAMGAAQRVGLLTTIEDGEVGLTDLGATEAVLAIARSSADAAGHPVPEVALRTQLVRCATEAWVQWRYPEGEVVTVSIYHFREDGSAGCNTDVLLGPDLDPESQDRRIYHASLWCADLMRYARRVGGIGSDAIARPVVREDGAVVILIQDLNWDQLSTIGTLYVAPFGTLGAVGNAASLLAWHAIWTQEGGA